MSKPHEHPVETGEKEPVHIDPDNGEIDPAEIEERPGYPDVQIPVPSAFTDVLHISMPKTGKLQHTKPQNTPESTVERQGQIQDILGKAATEALNISENTIHIGSFARKNPTSASINPNLNYWKAFSSAKNGSDPNAFTITHEQMQAFLKANPDPQKGNYAIIDLRSKKDFEHNGRHIKGAVHFPVNEETSTTLNTAWGLTLQGEPRSIGMSPKPEDVTRYREKWNNLLQTAPWNTLKEKDVVFFHCFASANRTPYFATGYLEYARPPGAQKVVIIENGYGNYDWGNLTEPYQLP